MKHIISYLQVSLYNILLNIEKIDVEYDNNIIYGIPSKKPKIEGKKQYSDRKVSDENYNQTSDKEKDKDSNTLSNDEKDKTKDTKNSKDKSKKTPSSSEGQKNASTTGFQNSSSIVKNNKKIEKDKEDNYINNLFNNNKELISNNTGFKFPKEIQTNISKASNHKNKKLEMIRQNQNFDVLLNNSNNHINDKPQINLNNSIKSQGGNDLIYPQSFYDKQNNSKISQGTELNESNRYHLLLHDKNNTLNSFTSTNKDHRSCSYCEKIYKEAIIYNKDINVKHCIDCLNKINPQSLEFYMEKYHNDLIEAQKQRLEKLLNNKF